MYKTKYAFLKYEHGSKSKYIFFIYLTGEHSCGTLIPYRLPVAVSICCITNYLKFSGLNKFHFTHNFVGQSFKKESGRQFVSDHMVQTGTTVTG